MAQLRETMIESEIIVSNNVCEKQYQLWTTYDIFAKPIALKYSIFTSNLLSDYKSILHGGKNESHLPIKKN